MRQHGGVVVSSRGLLVRIMARSLSPCMYGGSVRVLQLPPTVQRHVCQVNW